MSHEHCIPRGLFKSKTQALLLTNVCLLVVDVAISHKRSAVITCYYDAERYNWEYETVKLM